MMTLRKWIWKLICEKSQVQRGKIPKRFPKYDTAVVEVQYGCLLLDKKKAAVVVCMGRNNYTVVITITGYWMKRKQQL